VPIFFRRRFLLVDDQGVPDDIAQLLCGDESIQRLIDLRSSLPNGNWTCFVGSGLSSDKELPENLRMPGWGQLVRDCCAAAGMPTEPPPKAANYPEVLTEARHHAEAEDPALVRRVFGSSLCRVPPGLTTQTYQSVVALPFELFLTTNYDRLFVNAHDDVPEVAAPNRVMIYPAINPLHLSGRRLVHLHGMCSPDADQPEDALNGEAVVDSDDYHVAYNNRKLGSALAMVFTFSRVLFLGFSADDEHVRRSLAMARDDLRALSDTTHEPIAQRIHFSLALATPAVMTASDRRTRDFQFESHRLRIDPIWVRPQLGDEYGAIRLLIQWLGRTTPSGESAFA
jgi:hypothetical protein